MEQKVEFFRLVTGEDIVSEYDIDLNNNSYTLYNPCKVVYMSSAKPGFLSISLMQWIFSKLCEEQTFNLPMSQVLIKSSVTESMVDHYFQSVEYFEKKELNKQIDFDSPIDTDDEDLSETSEEGLELLKQIMDKINKPNKGKLH